MISEQTDFDSATGDILVSFINGGVYQHYDFGNAFINIMISEQSDFDSATGDILVPLINERVYQHHDF